MGASDEAGLDDAPFVVDWLDALVDAGRSPRTVDGYRRDVRDVGRHLLARLDVDDPTAVTPAMLADPAVVSAAFRAWTREDTGRRRRSPDGLRSASSRRRAWSALNGLFQHLLRHGDVDGNPMGVVAVPPQPASLPRDIDVRAPLQKLLTAAGAEVTDGRETRWPVRDVALVAAIALAGLRVSEAVGMDRRDVLRTDEPALRVRGKGNKDRTVPIAPLLVARIDDYLADRAERFGPLPSPGTDGLDDPRRALWVHKRHGRRITVNQLEHLVGRLYVRAGVAGAVQDGSRVHALRHHAAHAWLSAGAKTSEVQDLLGHASLQTTQRYVKARGSDLRAAALANPDYKVLDDAVVDG